MSLQISAEVRRKMGNTELWLCPPCWKAYRNHARHVSTACRGRGCECHCREGMEGEGRMFA